MRCRIGALLSVLILLFAVQGISLAGIATPGPSVHGRQLMRATLLSDAVALTDGEWVDVSGFSTLSIDVRGIGSATLEIDGSNEPTRPANNTHGNQLGSDITANGYIHIKTALRWLKIRVRVYGSGTISAYLEGRVD